MLSSHAVHFLYLDESGSAERPDGDPSASPVMVIIGVIIDARLVPLLTREFLELKRQFFPDRFTSTRALSHILIEVKGTEVLKLTRSANRFHRHKARSLRLALLDLLERYDCRLVGRVWVKQSNTMLKPTETYTFAVQDLAAHFAQFLLEVGSHGVIIGDSRNPGPNIEVAHSVFTQKWRTGGDPYPPLMEVPLFAHSDNHAGLQLADLVATSLIFPMACSAFGTPEGNVHASGRYRALRAEHGNRLRARQYSYLDETGRRRGGVVVSDPVGKWPSSRLFEPPQLPGAGL